jgi:lysophospholipase L1-like esterase
MKPYLLLLCLPLLIFACYDDDDFMPTENMNPTPTTTTDTITYLALGDSYTIGTAVTAAERWPTLLANALAEPDTNGQAYSTEPDIIAVNGWTTRNLISGINARDDLQETYGMVSLLIGVNNQFQGLPLAQYRTEFEQLLNRAIAFAGDDRSKVFVVSIPDYAFTGFGNGNPDISEGVRQFNEACREITERYGLPFLNITPISQEGGTDPALVASDNLHPSGKQYQRWVDEVIEDRIRVLLAQ